jgi:polyphosphate glucokinase
MIVLGVDFGGSSIKAAPVNIERGEIAAGTASVPTPQPSLPRSVARSIHTLVSQFEVGETIGVAFPAVIKNDIVRTAANIHESWIGENVRTLLDPVLGCRTVFLNDADAAGIAEMQFGAGRGRNDVVMIVTFGTGIGTALFVDGQLVPNTELGHLEIGGREAEHFASGRVRTVERLDWKEWAERVNEVLAAYHALLWPDLFILSGGVTEEFASFGHLLKSRAEIQPARFRAHAGIVGAALAAARARTEKKST